MHVWVMQRRSEMEVEILREKRKDEISKTAFKTLNIPALISVSQDWLHQIQFLQI